MLTVDQALETILNHSNRLETEEKPLFKAMGQVAAENIFADLNVPDLDVSARDGFAVRSQDTNSATLANPRILRVIETVMAGFATERRISPGTAIRIMTGAPIPIGADCVVSFEDTDNDIRNTPQNKFKEIRILREEKAGSNIRRSGEQIRKGELVVPQGSVIGPAEAGIIASLGYTGVKVVRRPVVAIIATGEELINPGQPLSNSKIYNGNSYGIAGQVQRSGGIPKIVGIARDSRSSLLSKIRRGLESDLVVTTGGVSMGDHDLVKDVLSDMGEIIFWQVSMTPGKYFTFALDHQFAGENRVKKIPHFALSGNPPASMVGFEVLVRPAILKMMGKSNLKPELIEAVMEDTIENVSGTRRFVWVTVKQRKGGCYARLSGSPSQGVISSIASAQGLAVLPEETRLVKKGEKLEVILLDWY